jgi:unsaturated rhamnogalacturonyl hydrolase
MDLYQNASYIVVKLERDRDMNGLFRVVVTASLLSIGTIAATAQQDNFANWPAGTSPQEIGKRVAQHFIVTPHQGSTIFYGEVGAWYGALAFAKLTSDTDLRDRLIKRFDPLLPGGSETNLIGKRAHVDDEIFGIVPLEIAMQTKDQKYLTYGKQFADRQWENPQPDGLSAETRAIGLTTCSC